MNLAVGRLPSADNRKLRAQLAAEQAYARPTRAASRFGGSPLLATIAEVRSNDELIFEVRW
jgi:hypothetical protein